MNVILVCSCGGMRDKAKTAFSILYPKDELPEMYVGRDAIKKFAGKHQGTNIASYAEATSKQNGQYSYYIEYDEKGDVTKIINLTNGKSVA